MMAQCFIYFKPFIFLNPLNKDSQTTVFELARTVCLRPISRLYNRDFTYTATRYVLYSVAVCQYYVIKHIVHKFKIMF